VIGRPCSSKSGDIVCADCARDQDADDEEETDTDRHTDY
jgi:hypothetical protein